jgi:hypothetical protein
MPSSGGTRSQPGAGEWVGVHDDARAMQTSAVVVESLRDGVTNEKHEDCVLACLQVRHSRLAHLILPLKRHCVSKLAMEPRAIGDVPELNGLAGAVCLLLQTT